MSLWEQYLNFKYTLLLLVQPVHLQGLRPHVHILNESSYKREQFHIFIHMKNGLNEFLALFPGIR